MAAQLRRHQGRRGASSPRLCISAPLSSQRISFILLQKRRRGNTRKSAWCRAPIPTLWM
ncbi:rCG62692, isoform CRA_b [Rattus norvegicus]|uniref:RCG62692, isoform CRA_b n=1 Tax=Rattus norvegicus TaxID=10116 RepID=A6J6K6_RAT|nr:rCG62692, isoform CRA_b [Rattus norvegicus]